MLIYQRITINKITMGCQLAPVNQRAPARIHLPGSALVLHDAVCPEEARPQKVQDMLIMVFLLLHNGISYSLIFNCYN